LCERAFRSLVTLRKEGQVELRGEAPKQLSAGAILAARPDGVNTFLLGKEKIIKPQIARIFSPTQANRRFQFRKRR
jgi:hypothetical protein